MSGRLHSEVDVWGRRCRELAGGLGFRDDEVISVWRWLAARLDRHMPRSTAEAAAFDRCVAIFDKRGQVAN